LIIGGGFLVGFALLFIVFGSFNFFVSLGLWKGQNWARITFIAYSVLNVILGLSILPFAGLFFSLVYVSLNIGIGLYFLLNNRVRLAFA
jgi:hypothetical protein